MLSTTAWICRWRNRWAMPRWKGTDRAARASTRPFPTNSIDAAQAMAANQVRLEGLYKTHPDALTYSVRHAVPRGRQNNDIDNVSRDVLPQGGSMTGLTPRA